jgi:hypothetical protein
MRSDPFAVRDLVKDAAGDFSVNAAFVRSTLRKKGTA